MLENSPFYGNNVYLNVFRHNFFIHSIRYHSWPFIDAKNRNYKTIFIKIGKEMLENCPLTPRSTVVSIELGSYFVRDFFLNTKTSQNFKITTAILPVLCRLVPRSFLHLDTLFLLLSLPPPSRFLYLWAPFSDTRPLLVS